LGFSLWTHLDIFGVRSTRNGLHSTPLACQKNPAETLSSVDTVHTGEPSQASRYCAPDIGINELRFNQQKTILPAILFKYFGFYRNRNHLNRLMILFTVLLFYVTFSILNKNPPLFYNSRGQTMDEGGWAQHLLLECSISLFVFAGRKALSKG
jgi:hypothetical protein